eukprot:6905822-Pyramimonas_sp.AAC.1
MSCGSDCALLECHYCTEQRFAGLGRAMAAWLHCDRPATRLRSRPACGHSIGIYPAAGPITAPQ